VLSDLLTEDLNLANSTTAAICAISNNNTITAY